MTKQTRNIAILTSMIFIVLLAGLVDSSRAVLIFLSLAWLSLFIKIDYRWWLLLAFVLLTLVPGNIYQGYNEPRANYLAGLAFLSLILSMENLWLAKFKRSKAIILLPNLRSIVKKYFQTDSSLFKNRLFLAIVILFTILHMLLAGPTFSSFIFALIVVYLLGLCLTKF